MLYSGVRFGSLPFSVEILKKNLCVAEMFVLIEYGANTSFGNNRVFSDFLIGAEILSYWWDMNV